MLIAARNVSLSLGTPPARVEILRGIDLNVTAGESVALLGPSGSGKSSLMAILAGLERPTGGTVEVAGLDFTALDEDALAVARRGRIGIVLQAFHLLPTMTARENVAVPLELAARPALILADEPTGNLDTATGATIMDLLFQRHDANRTTLFVITHDPALAARCARVIDLADGRVVADRVRA